MVNLRASMLTLSLLSLAGLSWGLARHPNQNEPLPTGLRNAIVRIEAFDRAGQGYGGTGIVIDIKPVQGTRGGWLCVLTADHVVYGNEALVSDWRVGFRDSNEDANWYNATIHFRAPQTGLPNVDLAILGVWINNLANIPTLTIPALGGARANDVVVMAGYGDFGNVQFFNIPNQGAVPGYRVVSDFGTYRSGSNTVDSIAQGGWNSNVGKNYQFEGLFTDVDFTVANNQIVAGEAYVLSKDSGGPTFRWIDRNGNGQRDADDEYVLVGIHSASDSRRDNLGEFIPQGSRSLDVHLGKAEYQQWIARQCALVPEPASMTALGVGLLTLLARRRRRTA